ncbi:hypothetical protein WJX73_005681 [Symbiochloris irregularis]|uniref:Uncharacterized protein n=1 Tax=Symbiochloris irregularis TaxID=706552 RepID=A0AAW1PF08_9CHLO
MQAQLQSPVKAAGAYLSAPGVKTSTRRRVATDASTLGAAAPHAATAAEREAQVLDALRNILDPDLGQDIVACNFVKDLTVTPDGAVAFRLQLTTPACPIKEDFRKQANHYVEQLHWVTDVSVTMDAVSPQSIAPQSDRPGGLAQVAHIIAVSSCKGGVGKSTTAVNLAYTLAQMGARVGIFDADVYGPSLPTMVSPEEKVMRMDPATRALTPTEYEGVKLVSFGFAGQGSAIMRGPMVSGLVQQLLTTAQWGALDYLVVDFPPGTGDIQLTLCQSVGFSAAVIVTTPQKLSFIDVAKGIRMFARLLVPCVAVVENMAYFEADGKRHFPFGRGSGERIQSEFGLPNLTRMPIVPDLSAAGDGGRPLVVADPTCAASQDYMQLGAAVVTEVAKLQAATRPSVRYDEARQAICLSMPDEAHPTWLDPAEVRRNDTSAKSMNEWMGQLELDMASIPDRIRPQAINPLGNYAVQITWEDGFNQVATFELLQRLQCLDGAPPALPHSTQLSATTAEQRSAAQQILATAQKL